MKNKPLFCGIDPGAKGAISLITSDKTVLLSQVVPTVKGSTPPEVDYRALYEIFENVMAIADDHQSPLVAVIEDVHSIYGSSAKSNFSFGKVVGVKQAFLVALEYDYKLIPPKKWQASTIEKQDIVKDAKGKKDNKLTAISAAKRLFPGVDLRKSSRATKDHDGKADSLLMAYYGLLTDNED